MNKERQLVHGVGVNDADYLVHPNIDGKQVMCPFYDRWKDMLKRCYSVKALEKRPTYLGCVVATDWLTFSTFRKWMIVQEWEGKALDKDLLIEGNRTYSSETCVFIDSALNSVLTSKRRNQGDCLIGVNWHKRDKTFESYVCIEGRQSYIGRFNNELDAHLAYSQAKSNVIYKASVNQSDPRVKEALIKRADKLSRLSEIREDYEQRQLLAA